MRGFKILISTTVLLAGLAMAPAAQAQISVNIGVQPVCPYGYYGYAPYQCAPAGYYGSGYFYNGIFLGMGPWAGWGYGHGWGGHRFAGDGGGSYHGGMGRVAYNGHSGGGQVRTGGGSRMNSEPSHAGGVRPNAGHVQTHAPASRAAAPHATAGQARGGGGAPHGGQPHGGESHGGGDHK